MAYDDLRDYIRALDAAGKLQRITRPVDKDWEISAVGKRMFQRIPDAKRRALLFENVRGYSIPVAAGVLGASRSVYALAMSTEPEHILEHWENALRNPIPPETVSNGPCKENVLTGEDVDLNRFPVPIWTVGQDPDPYLTAPQVVTMDPETKERNVGTYRIQVKGRNRTGIFLSWPQHGNLHFRKYEALGERAPIAIVLGSEPCSGLCSVSKVPAKMDEFAVAGGLRGKPLELVRCETVPLYVPAHAEIVIEGWIDPGYREQEGPFGEYTGYMGPPGESFVINVECITHRNDPIYHAFISQMPPSESSTIRGLGRESNIYKHLHDELGLPVRDVHLTHSGGSSAYLVISMKKQYDGQVQQALWGAWSIEASLGKITVVVDDDIDIREPFQVEWAMSFRMQPAKDVYVAENTVPVGLDPSLADMDVPQHVRKLMLGSKVGIDATKKHNYPAVSLPPKEHFDRADELWEGYGFVD